MINPFLLVWELYLKRCRLKKKKPYLPSRLRKPAFKTFFTVLVNPSIKNGSTRVYQLYRAILHVISIFRKILFHGKFLYQYQVFSREDEFHDLGLQCCKHLRAKYFPRIALQDKGWWRTANIFYAMNFLKNPSSYIDYIARKEGLKKIRRVNTD